MEGHNSVNVNNVDSDDENEDCMYWYVDYIIQDSAYIC